MTEQQMSHAERFQRIATAYGCWTGDSKTSMAKLMETPEWKAHFRNAPSVMICLKKMEQKKNVIPEVAAFFAGPAKLMGKFDKATKTRPVKATGVRVVLSNGDVIPVWNGKDPPATSFLGRVSVGPMIQRLDVVTGAMELELGDDPKVEISGHDAALPECSLEGVVARAKQLRTFGKNPRGVITGDSGDAVPAFLTLTIGGMDDVSYFGADGKFSKPGEEPVIQVKCTDVNGKRVTTKLSRDLVNEQFGLSDKAGRREYQENLASEPIAVSGKLGIFHPKDPDYFGAGVLEAEVAKLREMGLIRKTGSDADAYEGLFLTNYMVNKKGPDGADILDEEGQPVREQATFVEIGEQRTKVYDILQKKVGEEKDENGRVKPVLSWQASILVDDISKPPWFDCREHPSKSGDGRIFNEGAFVVFLNQMGLRKLREDDPTVQMVRDLGLDLEPMDAGKAGN